MEKELRWEKQWIPEHLSAVGNEPWDTVWDRLTDGFRPETVPAGTVFYQQGDPAREVIFLQTGQIRVECIHSSGKKRVLCLLFEGKPGSSHRVSSQPEPWIHSPGSASLAAWRTISRISSFDLK